MTEKEYNSSVSLYADNVFRFIVKNIRHTEDSKDIVQTAFEKLWRNREEIELKNCKSYLFTIAYNQMVDNIRKNERRQFNEELSEESKIGYQPGCDLQKTLMDAVSRLNEVQRSLVMLKDYEGYNYDEIGKIMGLNETQVKVYLHRARKNLKNYLVSQENVI
jgi:RNA polymerase sigma-70 factor (ECF subfamily)